MSDIEEDYDSLDFGPKFDLSDVENEDEFVEHEKTNQKKNLSLVKILFHMMRM